MFGSWKQRAQQLLLPFSRPSSNSHGPQFHRHSSRSVRHGVVAGDVPGQPQKMLHVPWQVSTVRKGVNLLAALFLAGGGPGAQVLCYFWRGRLSMISLAVAGRARMVLPLYKPRPHYARSVHHLLSSPSSFPQRASPSTIFLNFLQTTWTPPSPL